MLGIFALNMTIIAVAKGKIEIDNFLGFKRTLEQVLGCEPLSPGDYSLAHGRVSMDVAVGADDSVSIITKSIAAQRPRDTNEVLFGGSSLALVLLWNANDSVSVIPGIGEAALALGPDDLGITLSLERHRNGSRIPMAVGMMAIDKALKPKTKKSTVGAGTE